MQLGIGTVVDYCLENDIGKNEGFKEEIGLRKKDKQIFIGIPYALFIKYLLYKAKANGVMVTITEESYTSKASFVDRDIVSVYSKKDNADGFNGKRNSRGSYRTKDGMVLNADRNASGNIIRKESHDTFVGQGSIGVVAMSYVLSFV